MANPEHLRVLRKGVQVWNRWRDKHPRMSPDLTEADLHGAKLSQADLRRACLIRADFRRACLQFADLFGADLTGANLEGANPGGANFRTAKLIKTTLRQAQFYAVKPVEPCEADTSHAYYLFATDLRHADLTGANLFGATLLWVDFTGAVLGDADFSEAMMGFTTFGSNDLSKAKGLEAVRHQSPSIIGINTIYQSRGAIVESFLRGAGVPNDFIVYAKSFAANPIEFYSCFISYSSKDQEFAERLHSDLQSKGVRCWFAPEDLKIGDKFRSRIDESIRVYDKLMVVLTGNSIQSPWVEEEVEAALEKERQQNKLVLFPIRLDDAVMQTQQAWAASLRRIRHIGDFRNWKNHDSFKKALERLLRDLKAGKAEAKIP